MRKEMTHVLLPLRFRRKTASVRNTSASHDELNFFLYDYLEISKETPRLARTISSILLFQFCHYFFHKLFFRKSCYRSIIYKCKCLFAAWPAI